MENVIRIHCPSSEYGLDERLHILLKEIETWVYSTPLKELIELYGGIVPSGMHLLEYIQWLNDFVNIWDFRKKQSNGGERWLVADDEKCAQNQEMILRNAYLLGLIDSENPCEKPDYILPLGGARLANLARAKGAREMADYFKDGQFSIAALTGKRPLNEIEIPYLKEYASDAKNEYEAMNGGLEKTFGLSECEYMETNYVTKNCNMMWSKREYTTQYKNHKIYSLAAPSSDPGRRANSFDTFQFFMDSFEIKERQRLLLVTSCIYVPFQLLKFIPISLNKNIEVDCFGVSPAVSGSQFSKPSNYLQEIKGVVNAIYHVVSLCL